MDKIIERALEHWYRPSHKLYGNSLPALLGIVGESGELADLWKKKLYKPSYVLSRDEFLDELGDCLFYAAVLCRYCDIETNAPLSHGIEWPVIDAVVVMVYNAAKLLSDNLTLDVELDKRRVARIIGQIRSIGKRFDVTLDQLSEMNFAKLNERAANGKGYNRGNERQYICNRADGCGIKCGHKAKHIYDSIEQECGEVGCHASGLSDATCIPCTDDECPSCGEEKEQLVICEQGQMGECDKSCAPYNHYLPHLPNNEDGNLQCVCTTEGYCNAADVDCQCIPYIDDRCSE